MSGSLGGLNIYLGLNTLDFEKALNSSDYKTQKFTKQLQVNFENAQQRVKTFSERTTKYLNNIEKAANSINNSTKWQLVETATRVLGGSAKNAAQQIIKLADAHTELKNRIKLVTEDSVSEAKAIQAVYDISSKTFQSADATAQVYTKFASSAKELGIAQSEVARLTETVNKTIALSGVSAASAEAGLLQFSQALDKGRLNGQELSSVMTQTPALAKAIADGLGVPVGALKELGEKGVLTTDVIIKALQKMGVEIDRLFSANDTTLSGAFVNLNNAAQKWVGELNQGLVSTKSIADVVNTIANNFDTLAERAGQFALVGGYFLARPKIQQLAEYQKSLKIAKEKQIVEREAAKTLSLTTQANYEKARSEYNLAQAEVQNIAYAKQQIVVERELLVARLKSATTQEQRAALTSQILSLRQQELAMTKLQKAAEEQVIAIKQGVKVAYMENAVAQSAYQAGLIKSSALMNVYRGVVRGVTAELQMMKAAFLSNPLMLGITALTVVASFAGYWFATADATEEATQKAKDYVQSVDASKAALEKMSAAALQKQLKDLEESKAAFNKKIEEQKKKAAELQKQLEELNKGEMLNYGADSLYSFASNAEKVKKVQGELIDLNADLDQSMRDLDATNERYNATREHYNQLLGIGSSKTPDVTDKTFLFSKSLDELGISAEDAKNKLQSLFSMFAGQGILAFQQGDKIVGYANDKLQEDLNKLAADKVRAGLKGKALYKHDAEQAAKNKGYQGEAKDKFVDAYVSAELAKESNRRSGGSKKSKIDYVKQYTDQLTQMQQRLAELKANASDIALYGDPSQYQEVNKLTQDIAANAEKYKHFGTEGQAKLKAMAEQIDKAQQAVNIAQFTYNNEQKLKAMEFELELLGKTRQEQELLRYGHQLDIEAARLKIGMSEENIAKLDEEIEKLKKRNAELQKQKEKAKNDPMQGIKNGWEAIEADVTDVSKNIENITVNAFNGMSDALTELAMTGKANFGDLARSIIKDIVQMTIRMAMFKAISSAFGYSSGGSVTAPPEHWKGGLVGFDTGGFTGLGGKYTPAGIVHKGEYVITKEATSRIGLDYLNYLNYGGAFAGRRGFANGGGVAVPKVPVVGQRDNNSTQNITVKVINQGEPVQAEVSTKQKGDQLEITLELMKTIARNEANQVIQTNFRAGGAFS
ncbi:tape measure protein [Avibacterium sp. 20-15]|uniref:tape measure protein n=1 Tax=unclassified Avibacterium TaxID=2685287 RepID=UPI0020271C7C|nr:MULTISPECIES: tape measure protein [unclassified Avibacterium]MCW9733744.1 tape measure protein [Avibacterium sp. 20-15]URL03593.1 tape measure protein [Avibacterium sp. 20-132]